MAFQAPVESYNGKIKEVTIGKGDKAVTVGGESALPFYLFEGEMPRRPLIAVEVYDAVPPTWPDSLKNAIGTDVIDDPVKWAKKCEADLGADLVCLQLASTDPNGLDRAPEEAVETVKAVAEAVSIPLVVYGSGNAEKDAEVLKKVAEVAQGKSILIGPAVEDNYKSVAAAALGFEHNVAGQTPIDVNMAKQLNILMSNLGLPAERILIDPSTGALGYGLEYTYSVMERDRIAALQQSDTVMQAPIICNLGKEAWKTKEARVADEPAWGDQEKRGIMWEAITAVSLLVAGADILIMAHPKSIELVRQAIDGLMSKS